MSNANLTARAYNLGRKVISSEYMPRDHVREFLRDVKPDEIVVELGSGNRRLTPEIINVDLFPFANVDFVAEAERTPIRSESVDRVVVDTILEHVPEPHKVVDEIFRILRPGGSVVCLVPFIFPYHAYPRHYFNMSRDGLEFLFRRFSRCTVETNMGPTTALVNLAAEYAGIALSENNRVLYSIGKGVTLMFLFVFKYLDALWARAPGRATSPACFARPRRNDLSRASAGVPTTSQIPDAANVACAAGLAADHLPAFRRTYLTR